MDLPVTATRFASNMFYDTDGTVWMYINDIIKYEAIAKKSSLDQAIADFTALAASYEGIATIAGTPDPSISKGFWVATETGTYTNYGGLVIQAGYMGVISLLNDVFTLALIPITPGIISKIFASYVLMGTFLSGIGITSIIYQIIVLADEKNNLGNLTNYTYTNGILNWVATTPINI